jgi:sec-independent protein translocase protein TatC
MGKAKKSPDEMTFLEHLEDLRKRLFNSIIALLIAVFPAWFFAKDLYRIIAHPLEKYLPEGTRLAYGTLSAPFMIYMKTAFIAAIFFMSPYIFLQLWYFIAPGLFRKEKKYVIPFVLMTSFFFIGGALFGYFIVFPFACRFFLNLGAEFQPVIMIDKYFTFALRILIGIAIVFELPTLVFFLSRMGLVTAKWMVKKFKYAVLAAFVIAAVITPTPDMMTQSIIAIPMLILYGLSIGIALLFGKKDQQSRKDKAKQKEEKAGKGKDEVPENKGPVE